MHLMGKVPADVADEIPGGDIVAFYFVPVTLKNMTKHMGNRFKFFLNVRHFRNIAEFFFKRLDNLGPEGTLLDGLPAGANGRFALNQVRKVDEFSGRKNTFMTAQNSGQ